MSTWYPISPFRMPDGTLTAFAGLPDAEKYRPEEPPGGLADLELGAVKVRQRSLRIHAAVSLGLAALGSASTTGETLVLAYDVMRFHEHTHREAGPILRTRWGSGLRLTLTIHDMEVNANVSIGVLAARGELEALHASYDVEGLGFTDPTLLTLLPGPGRFDLETYDTVLDAIDAVKAAMDDRTRISPVPVQIELAKPPFQEPVDQAQAVWHAMTQLRRRAILSTATRTAIELGLDVDTVRAAYRAVQGDPREPSKDDVAAAKRWISEAQ